MTFTSKTYLAHIVGIGPDTVTNSPRLFTATWLTPKLNFPKSKPTSLSPLIACHGRTKASILAVLTEHEACQEIVRLGGHKKLVRALQAALHFRARQQFVLADKGIEGLPTVPFGLIKFALKFLLHIGGRLAELIMRGSDSIFNWLFERGRAREDCLLRRAGWAERAMVSALYVVYMAATFVGVYTLGGEGSTHVEEAEIVGEKVFFDIEVTATDEAPVITDLIDSYEVVSHIGEAEEFSSEPEVAFVDGVVARFEDVQSAEADIIVNASEPETASIAEVVEFDEVSHIEFVEDSQLPNEATVFANDISPELELAAHTEVVNNHEAFHLVPILEANSHSYVDSDISSSPVSVPEFQEDSEVSISSTSSSMFVPELARNFTFCVGPTVDEVPACNDSLDTDLRVIMLDTPSLGDSDTDEGEDGVDKNTFVDDMALDNSSESESGDNEIVEGHNQSIGETCEEVVEVDAHEKENRQIAEHGMENDEGMSLSSSIDLDIASFIEEPDSGSIRESKSSPAVLSKLGEISVDFSELEDDEPNTESMMTDGMNFVFASIAPGPPTCIHSSNASTDATFEVGAPITTAPNASIDQSCTTNIFIKPPVESEDSSSSDAGASFTQDFSENPSSNIASCSINHSMPLAKLARFTTTVLVQQSSEVENFLITSSRIADEKLLFEPTSAVPVVKINRISVPRPAIQETTNHLPASFINNMRLNTQTAPIFVPGRRFSGTPKPKVQLGPRSPQAPSLPSRSESSNSDEVYTSPPSHQRRLSPKQPSASPQFRRLPRHLTALAGPSQSRDPDTSPRMMRKSSSSSDPASRRANTAAGPSEHGFTDTPVFKTREAGSSSKHTRRNTSAVTVGTPPKRRFTPARMDDLSNQQSERSISASMWASDDRDSGMCGGADAPKHSNGEPTVKARQPRNKKRRQHRIKVQFEAEPAAALEAPAGVTVPR